MNAVVKAFVDVETFDRLGTGKWRGEKLMRIKNTYFVGKRSTTVVNICFTVLTFVRELCVFSSPHNFPSLITGVANSVSPKCPSVQRKISDVTQFSSCICGGISVYQLLNSIFWLRKILNGSRLNFPDEMKRKREKRGS